MKYFHATQMRSIVFECHKFGEIFVRSRFLSLDSEIDFTKTKSMTYLHFYATFIYIFMYFFIFLLIYQVVYGHNVYCMYSFV